MSTTDSPHASGFLSDPATPRWMRDLFRFLPVKSQFILSNNVRDRYPFPGEGGKYVPLPLIQYLAEALKLRGYQRFICFNAIDGFRPVVPRGENESENYDFFRQRFKLEFDGPRPSLEKSLEIIEPMAGYNCGFDLSAARPGANQANRLFLVIGRENFECKDGDTLGREGTLARSFFSGIGTVSRRHASLTHRNGCWFVTVSPTVQNMTQLDGRELPRGVDQPLSGEHILKLSTQCEVRLTILGG